MVEQDFAATFSFGKNTGLVPKIINYNTAKKSNRISVDSFKSSYDNDRKMLLNQRKSLRDKKEITTAINPVRIAK